MAETFDDLTIGERRAWHRQADALPGPLLPPERNYRFTSGVSVNAHGISHHDYLRLALYYIDTGNALSYERLMEFYLNNKEPDGCQRLYNSGAHPDIEAFVNWFVDAVQYERITTGNDRELYFRHDLLNILLDYRDQNPMREGELPISRGYSHLGLRHLSPEALDALVRAYIDPNYSLDLTGLLYPGTGWVHIERLYAELLEIRGYIQNELPMIVPLGREEEEGGFTRTIFGFSGIALLRQLSDSYLEDGGVAAMAAEREWVALQGGGD
ncbi:MAG: hypothetical protein FWD83_06860 [Promicromonosporaceae bacterium]|nr:hypothetical protein [Promicromonosporaceae bacterium]